MISLLKTFGKGILYVIGAPFFVLALALFGVIGLGAFIFQIIKSIIYFFTGQTFFPELAEDKKLRLMREAAKQEKEEQKTSDVFSPLYQEPKVGSEYEKQMAEQEETIFMQREAPAPAPQPVAAPTPAPAHSIEDAVFEDTSSLEDFIEQEEDDIPEAPAQEEVVEEQHTVLETNETPKEEEEDFEVLDTYVPRSSTYSAADDDEDNDTDSGVDIFNL